MNVMNSLKRRRLLVPTGRELAEAGLGSRDAGRGTRDGGRGTGDAGRGTRDGGDWGDWGDGGDSAGGNLSRGDAYRGSSLCSGNRAKKAFEVSDNLQTQDKGRDVLVAKELALDGNQILD